MEKILECLKQLGASDELANKVIELLEEHKKKVKESLEEDFQDKLSRAKKVCLETVEKHKRDVSKKVEIFLEARRESIDREMRKNQAIEEAESIKALKQLKQIVEGVQIDGKLDSKSQAELKALRVRNRQLEEKVETLAEQRDRSNSIASKALQREKRILESQKRSGNANLTESKSKKPSKSLEGLRKKKTKSKTKRPIQESTQRPATKKQNVMSGDPEIDKIANSVEPDLARHA